MAHLAHIQSARLGQALANPLRLRLLNLMCQNSCSVGELALAVGESVASTSAQVKVLREVGLITSQRQGRQVFCELSSPHVVQWLSLTQHMAEACLPEMRELVAADQAEEATAVELNPRRFWEQLKRAPVTLIDLRPAKEFAHAHLPGAQSLPPGDWDESLLRPLRSRGEIFGYCRGPWCVLAREGIARLNHAGIAARRLRFGVLEWRAQDLKLEVGTN